MSSIEQGILNIARVAEIANPCNNEDYIGENGLLYCYECDTPKQTITSLFGINRVVSCMCKCAMDKDIELKELFAQQKKTEQIKRNKKLAYAFGYERSATNFTFDNDDSKGSENSLIARNYAKSFDVNESGWLVFFGSNGTGKSYLATCICNALLERGYSVVFVRLAELERKLFNSSNGKNDIYENLVQCDLLVIDDLFAERDTSYMKEIAFNVIDSRSKCRKPAIITTNLSPTEFSNPTDVNLKRILDRIYEDCIPIRMNGESRRKQNMMVNAEKRKMALLNYSDDNL